MTRTSVPIYSNGARPGVVRYWHFEVEGDSWRGHYGIVGGKDAVSGWSKASVKNAGRSNATTPEEQAYKEACAQESKKLAREYRQIVEELVDVPPAVMLAEDYNKLKSPLMFNPGSVFVQPKLDGIRLTASKRGAFSREFQPFYTADHIMAALEPVIKKYPDIILDGELYNHSLKEDFNKISSLVRKKKLTADERFEVERTMQYHIYDLPSHDGGFEMRAAALGGLFGEFDFSLDPILEVETYAVDNLDAMEDMRTRWLERGYEGMMIRTAGEPYQFGQRPWQLMKHKADKITEEFPVSKLLMGNGNFAGLPKAVEIIMPDDKRNEKGERQKAGIKGDMEFLATLLTAGHDLVTIEYFGRTPAGMLRFPVAVDWHHGERTD